jgi:hypothetical protein
MDGYPVPAKMARIENVVVNSRFMLRWVTPRHVDEAHGVYCLGRAEMPDATHMGMPSR